MLSGILRPFGLGLNMLKKRNRDHAQETSKFPVGLLWIPNRCYYSAAVLKYVDGLVQDCSISSA